MLPKNTHDSYLRIISYCYHCYTCRRQVSALRTQVLAPSSVEAFICITVKSIPQIWVNVSKLLRKTLTKVIKRNAASVYKYKDVQIKAHVFTKCF